MILKLAFLALSQICESNFGTARTMSSGKVSSNNLASIFISSGSPASAEALKLRNLSLDLRFKAALDSGNLKHALLCLKAISIGCKNPETLNKLSEFRETLKTGSFAAILQNAPVRQETISNSLELPEFNKVSPFKQNTELLDTFPVAMEISVKDDDIDWDAPLRNKKKVN